MNKVAMMMVLGLAGASTLSAADADIDRWFEKKFGRPTPVRQAEIKAERDNAAFRAEPKGVERTDHIEKHYLGKLGRNTPLEEERLQNTGAAYRADPAPPAKPWMDQWFEKKFGRTPGR